MYQSQTDSAASRNHIPLYQVGLSVDIQKQTKQQGYFLNKEMNPKKDISLFLLLFLNPFCELIRQDENFLNMMICECNQSITTILTYIVWDTMTFQFMFFENCFNFNLLEQFSSIMTIPIIGNIYLCLCLPYHFPPRTLIHPQSNRVWFLCLINIPRQPHLLSFPFHPVWIPLCTFTSTSPFCGGQDTSSNTRTSENSFQITTAK